MKRKKRKEGRKEREGKRASKQASEQASKQPRNERAKRPRRGTKMASDLDPRRRPCGAEVAPRSAECSSTSGPAPDLPQIDLRTGLRRGVLLIFPTAERRTAPREIRRETTSARLRPREAAHACLQKPDGPNFFHALFGIVR